MFLQNQLANYDTNLGVKNSAPRRKLKANSKMRNLFERGQKDSFTFELPDLGWWMKWINEWVL